MNVLWAELRIMLMDRVLLGKQGLPNAPSRLIFKCQEFDSHGYVTTETFIKLKV